MSVYHSKEKNKIKKCKFNFQLQITLSPQGKAEGVRGMITYSHLIKEVVIIVNVKIKNQPLTTHNSPHHHNYC